MKINIQQLDNTYSDELINLILTIQQKEFNVPITIDDQPDLKKVEEFYIESGGNFWGAFINSELVGSIALVKFDDKAGAVRKMFVKKECRGKEFNIAQELLEVLISFCRKTGIEKIYLGTVDILKAAIRFYERNYFLETKKEDLPARFPLMSADNVFYSLNVN
ncbi:GNAT family N-acetyltransferase [Chryseobacterium camelliae]|uniref:GNAT family N-acetyltransferase n=1 Tax=Chryseobacterium camelliae TaxID=1265445 RepID=UPI002862B5A7|nr:GNAT family N-acetyltransferase [Chryseobacterium camelliae]MDR6515560.1 N-acetylglutamate synthase-like GNAT family acetyltransferase [Chryseobacterium camelliae]